MEDIEKKHQANITRRQERNTFLPATDIWETPEEITLRMDMPGVSKENLEIKVEGDTLTVHGGLSQDQPGNVLYAEQRIGDFHREFSLSDDLDREKINAALNAGVLTLTVSKAEKIKPRKIQISAN
ncbi:MAG: Hsp20 family protein [Sedimentisphaerales bacterium]|nr:Hsp20 family protein [Sedimentisphaerales bacterium]